MADNPFARAAHRRAADTGRRAAERVGVRPTLVTVCLETWSGPVGTTGATLTSTDSLVLDPRPRVERIDAGHPSFYASGYGTTSEGTALAANYHVGPMTLPASWIGYTLAQLMPAGGVTHRVYVKLEGDGFPAGGQRFEVHAHDGSRPHQSNLYVHQASTST